jgi:hypothetical protein
MRVIARVTAVRIEESWEIPGSRVRCVARLTRPLSTEEIRRLEESKVFRVDGAVVTYGCRPQDSEELAARLQNELGRAARVGLKPSTGRRRFPVPAGSF